uniref:Uncharacterized protein n=1 Tax=Gasterosteus aculeatus TaxID=69293 RepID=G3Q1Z3_GASAC
MGYLSFCGIVTELFFRQIRCDPGAIGRAGGEEGHREICNMFFFFLTVWFSLLHLIDVGDSSVEAPLLVNNSNFYSPSSFVINKLVFPRNTFPREARTREPEM